MSTECDGECVSKSMSEKVKKMTKKELYAARNRITA